MLGRSMGMFSTPFAKMHFDGAIIPALKVQFCQKTNSLPVGFEFSFMKPWESIGKDANPCESLPHEKKALLTIRP